MKWAAAVVLLASSFFAASGNKGVNNAIEKVYGILHDLRDKITAENKRQSEVNDQYLTWCAEQTGDSKAILSHANMEKVEAEADKEKAETAVENAVQAIDEATTRLGTNNKEIQESEAERTGDIHEFSIAKSELESGIATLDKAIKTISTEMGRTEKVSMAQIDMRTMDKMLESLSTIFDAAAVSSSDQKHLMAFIQASRAKRSHEDTVGAPATDGYETSSGGILETLENIKEQAETDLASRLKGEQTGRVNFESLQQSLKNEVTVDNKELQSQTSKKTSAEEDLAKAQGELDRVTENIRVHTKNLADLEKDCNAWKRDYEKFKDDQAKEMEALVSAGEAITTAIGNVGASSIQVSSGPSHIDSGLSEFPEVAHPSQGSSGLSEFPEVVLPAESHVPLALLQTHSGTSLNKRTEKVLGIVRSLAKKQHSKSLAQLASRIKTIMRYESPVMMPDDTFGKVKNLLANMIEDTTQKIQMETEEKEACDRELNETVQDLDALNVSIDDLTAKWKLSNARRLKMSDDWQSTLETMKKDEGEWIAKTRVNQKETEAHYATEKELKDGLAAIRQAISILRNFYDLPAPEPIPDLPEEPVRGGCSVTRYGCCADDETGKANEAGTNCAEYQGPQPIVDEPPIDGGDGTFPTPEPGAAASFLQLKASAKTGQPEEDDGADRIPALRAQKSVQGGSNIVALLETVEDEIAASLSEEGRHWIMLQRSFTKADKDYKDGKASNEKDASYYKGQWKSARDKTAEFDSDLDDEKKAKQIKMKLFFQIMDRCVQKPESYEERSRKRMAEVKGLQIALEALEDDTVQDSMLQTRTQNLRGLRRHTD